MPPAAVPGSPPPAVAVRALIDAVATSAVAHIQAADAAAADAQSVAALLGLAAVESGHGLTFRWTPEALAEAQATVAEIEWRLDPEGALVVTLTLNEEAPRGARS